MQEKTPLEIKLLQKLAELWITFNDGQQFKLPCEYLRVFSPSVEVQGHSGVAKKLVAGKKAVNIVAIEPVGQYAVKLIFDDGHQTGLYNWSWLYELGVHYQRNWLDYLNSLQQAGLSREPEERVS